MSLPVDWWQAGWLLAGFFFLLFVASAIVGKGTAKRALAVGFDDGWHKRQHWETDEEISGKLRHQH
jgi:hypothetical protein